MAAFGGDDLKGCRPDVRREMHLVLPHCDTAAIRLNGNGFFRVEPLAGATRGGVTNTIRQFGVFMSPVGSIFRNRHLPDPMIGSSLHDGIAGLRPG